VPKLFLYHSISAAATSAAFLTHSPFRWLTAQSISDERTNAFCPIGGGGAGLINRKKQPPIMLEEDANSCSWLLAAGCNNNSNADDNKVNATAKHL
jgi:hypothetical protein